ncbi:MAG: uroporphyrinogen decarboxylase family protein [Planctomycetota bacterium]
MTRREHFFQVLEGERPAAIPFFPDITDWYIARRATPGQPQPFPPGGFIPDDHPFHKQPGTMPERFRGWTLLDFYRRLGWGFPVHLYGWCDEEYSGGVERVRTVEGNRRITRFITPSGELRRVSLLAADGSWAPHEHYVKSLADLDVIRLIVENTHFVPHYERIESTLSALGDQGVGDVVIMRSPFGKLVHEYMGFDRVVYALADEPDTLLDFMALQETKDLEFVELAAEAPARLVILSDHADENLISPRQYEQYCVPYYRKMTAILHGAGKFVSTHLDGNFKGFFPVLGETGFDLLDGCTPAPMFNYEVEELAAALPEGMSAYCGVPATLFCQGLPTGEILEFGDRIADLLAGRGILNIGDILPAAGDLDQVIALGEHIRGRTP